MKELFKSKLVTGLIVLSTIILAGVAIYTAIRLYQLRNKSISVISPDSNPLAWDCTKYVFSINNKGEVIVTNLSSRDEPAQQAKVYINDNLIATLDVPAVNQGDSKTLGTVQIPQDTSYTWRVAGTNDCVNSGTNYPAPKACTQLTFNIVTPSGTPSPTSTPAPTNTPLPTPTGTYNPTSTPQPSSTPQPTSTSVPGPTSTPVPNPTSTSAPNPTSTSAPGPTSTSSPNPTSTPALANATSTPGGAIAAASPTPGGGILPEAGISTPTILSGALGLLLILFALAVAL